MHKEGSASDKLAAQPTLDGNDDVCSVCCLGVSMSCAAKRLSRCSGVISEFQSVAQAHVRQACRV